MPTETEALNSATEASRESIGFDVNESVVRLRDVHMLIRSIFKARGTCAECKYFSFESSECSITDEIIESEFFCADFKRKEK